MILTPHPSTCWNPLPPPNSPLTFYGCSSGLSLIPNNFCTLYIFVWYDIQSMYVVRTWIAKFFLVLFYFMIPKILELKLVFIGDGSGWQKLC